MDFRNVQMRLLDITRTGITGRKEIIRQGIHKMRGFVTYSVRNHFKMMYRRNMNADEACTKYGGEYK
jgi:hypothetical protein